MSHGSWYHLTSQDLSHFHFFHFRNDFFEQTYGVAMGSPVSPIVANIFVEDFESKALASACLLPKLWKTFLDDTNVI